MDIDAKAVLTVALPPGSELYRMQRNGSGCPLLDIGRRYLAGLHPGRGELSVCVVSRQHPIY